MPRIEELTPEEQERGEKRAAELAEIIVEALDAESRRQKFNVGEAMTALFAVFMSSAMASPEFSPEMLVKMVDERVRHAVGMTKQ